VLAQVAASEVVILVVLSAQSQPKKGFVFVTAANLAALGIIESLSSSEDVVEQENSVMLKAASIISIEFFMDCNFVNNLGCKTLFVVCKSLDRDHYKEHKPKLTGYLQHVFKLLLVG
jgi:hypothetical protein